MLHDDIMIQAAIEAIAKCEINLHNDAVACLEQNLGIPKEPLKCFT